MRGHTDFAYDVAFSPDGGRVASAAWDGTVRIWDVTTGRQACLLKHEEPIVTSVALPRHVTWELTDSVIDHFWLAVPEPGKDEGLDVTLRDNEARITTRNVGRFDLDLDGRLVDFDRPLRVSVDGKEEVVKVAPRLLTLCQSLLERGDLGLAFTCRVPLRGGKK